MAELVTDSPIGALRITSNGNAITRIEWTDDPVSGDGDDVSRETADQLAAYFEQKLFDFTVPCAPAGSDLVIAVCQAMQTIPYGEVWTYGQMAESVKSEPRAVGAACGGNPIPIVIPCHRVVGGGGKLTGFSGGNGVETKAKLLALEKANGQLL